MKLHDLVKKFDIVNFFPDSLYRVSSVVVEIHFWLYVYEIFNPIRLNWIYDDFSSSFFLRIKITFFEICCIASLFVWKNVKFWPSFLQLISPLNWVKSLGLWGMQFFFSFSWLFRQNGDNLASLSLVKKNAAQVCLFCIQFYL